MILNFRIGNWMSFRDEAEFTLLASSERQHGDRVPRVEALQKRILPIAAIYGGNASGKTNLFRALHALQTLVVQGVAIDAPIRVEPFRLDTQAPQKPSSFAIESISLRRGTPLSVILLVDMRHAAMIGNALFLLPLISILPLRRVPPCRMKESIPARPWACGPKL